FSIVRPFRDGRNWKPASGHSKIRNSERPEGDHDAQYFCSDSHGSSPLIRPGATNASVPSCKGACRLVPQAQQQQQSIKLNILEKVSAAILAARGSLTSRGLPKVAPQVPPAPSLRCARTALRYRAWPSYRLPGQSAAEVNCGADSPAV